MIVQEPRPRPILDVAAEIGLSEADLELYGRDKAKIALAAVDGPARAKGRLILVSAINPTPAGEGKTTTAIALAMGLRRRGKNAILALREPSLGPIFGIKGGGTGGGKASLVPTDDINLHFTGDIHAVTTAHNLLSALVDNALHFRDPIDLDPRQVTWGRALDMNDRALRRVIVGLGGKGNGVPREERFDITAASEIMAILALSTGYEDLEARLARVIVGSTTAGKPVTAGQIGAPPAMVALLRDALKPNLVQTAEGGPAFVHAGPFGNIAHGCSSLIATRLAMRLGDYVVTEGGFGFDLGGEKFLDIKCRLAGVFPRAVVLVATLRALKMHGGVPVREASAPGRDALRRGLEHLEKHVESVRAFGLPPVIAINVFPQDPPDEIALVEAAGARLGVRVGQSAGFARGGEGATDLADIVSAVADATDAAPPQPRFLYALSEPAEAKIRAVAQIVYGARDIELTAGAQRDLKRIGELGAVLPVCMAKTQASLTDDPARVGRPRDFVVNVREVRLNAGAGFLVALTGEMLTMPGLPRAPSAGSIRLLPSGSIRGLMQGD